LSEYTFKVSIQAAIASYCKVQRSRLPGSLRES